MDFKKDIRHIIQVMIGEVHQTLVQTQDEDARGILTPHLLDNRINSVRSLTNALYTLIGHEIQMTRGVKPREQLGPRSPALYSTAGQHSTWHGNTKPNIPFFPAALKNFSQEPNSQGEIGLPTNNFLWKPLTNIPFDTTVPESLGLGEYGLSSATHPQKSFTNIPFDTAAPKSTSLEPTHLCEPFGNPQGGWQP